ncbi:ABC transporter ATP-binding protein [Bacillus sp. HMF5848]|uniref:ABC transporter ATP-binding protein n=1 Tax=Bacillus sp. HMF5848 TaxID=2495421 RepID=UPI000F778FE8|nr:ABC transporter ATP-binding protein [Bacillus sp. HMF5848]RSK29003.1 ABC transporter ATP-binding protein [Bacillus sp. HMF5848]
MFYINANSIQKSYGQRNIVKSMNINIFKHEILAVIGPNGAGKSTTLEMLVGLRKPDKGEINYWQVQHKTHMGVQLQSVPFFPGLTTVENLQIFAAFYKKKMRKLDVEELLSRCGLTDCSHTEAAKLSGGQQKRLAIAASLIHDPELVFLDEPTAALDPRARMEIHQLIGKLYNDGKTVVLTSHDMDEVMKLAHRVIMINEGVIIAEGEPLELCKQFNAKDLDSLYLQLTCKEVN